MDVWVQSSGPATTASWAHDEGAPASNPPPPAHPNLNPRAPDNARTPIRTSIVPPLFARSCGVCRCRSVCRCLDDMMTKHVSTTLQAEEGRGGA